MQLTLLDELADARQWRKENPHAYEQIIEWAQEDATWHGRCSIQAYFEALRSPAISRRLGLQWSDSTYKLNHNLKAPVTRLILTEYPDLPFHIRRSKCDTGQATSATPVIRDESVEQKESPIEEEVWSR